MSESRAADLAGNNKPGSAAGVTFTVHTDGAALRNPGAAGWACRIAGSDGRVEDDMGGMRFATNNQMELTAAIEALKRLPVDARGVVVSDAKYVVDGVTMWRPGWELNGWRNASRKAVKNREMWEELFALVDAHPRMKFEWVKGHGSDLDNHAVDNFAHGEAERQRRLAEKEKAGA